MKALTTKDTKVHEGKHWAYAGIPSWDFVSLVVKDFDFLATDEACLDS